MWHGQGFEKQMFHGWRQTMHSGQATSDVISKAINTSVVRNLIKFKFKNLLTKCIKVDLGFIQFEECSVISNLTGNYYKL